MWERWMVGGQKSWDGKKVRKFEREKRKKRGKE